MRAVILVLLVCLCFLGCEGPTGPDGKDGKDGTDLDVVIFTGILTVGGFKDAFEGNFPANYWIIDAGYALDFYIVDVRIRPGEGYTWRGSWFDVFGTKIYLYEYRGIEPGWEYRILIAR